jgi:hypothetical protein
VFDGIGALVVRCDIDPEQLVEKIDRHSGTGALTWIAPKISGPDITPPQDIYHCIDVWRALGLKVGGWIYNLKPLADVQSVVDFAVIKPLDFVVYDVEAPYKADEVGGHFEYSAQLVAEHHAKLAALPAAVTSYGAYKNTIDFPAFAGAGWPMLAQVYDSFADGDELTYEPIFPLAGLHRLARRLTLVEREAVYRPEGIDG